MKKILHPIVLLALIVALIGGALTFVNNITTPVIAINELAAEKGTLKEVCPDVGDGAFVKVKDNVSRTIEKMFEVEGKGYIFETKVIGHKDGTSYLVALSKDGGMYDYAVIPSGSTQGLDSKVVEKPFRESLKGKDAAGEETLDDTITGATASNKSVIEGTREAVKYQAESLKWEVGKE